MVQPSDAAEVEKFARFLRRVSEHPEEPLFVVYAEMYGEVVFEDSGRVVFVEVPTRTENT